MGRIAHVSAIDGIWVDVLQFLSHHLLAFDNFRVAAFLPELKLTVALVADFVIFQAVKQRSHMSFFEVINDASRGVRLEIADFFREILG